VYILLVYGASQADRSLRYRAIGYARGEAPLGYAEPVEEFVVKYDKDVLRRLENRDDFA
jgi:hypothetical protein